MSPAFTDVHLPPARRFAPVTNIMRPAANSERPWVVFDMDEVVCNLRQGVQAALAKRFGTYPHWVTWNRYFHFNDVGLDLNSFLEILVEDRVCENAPVEPGAAEAIRAVRAMGYRTAIVTARGYHPHALRMTLDWLGEKGIELDAVHIVGMMDDKTDVICSLGPIAAYIDDLASHLLSLSRRCNSAVLVLRDKPWNRDANVLWRIEDMSQFVELVEGHSTLSP